MLLYTSRSPGWGKQKIKQWGPLSAVRSAVFANAERMGIDYAALLSYICPWEGAGSSLYDFAGQKRLIATNGQYLSWDNDDLGFYGSTSDTSIGPHYETNIYPSADVKTLMTISTVTRPEDVERYPCGCHDGNNHRLYAGKSQTSGIDQWLFGYGDSFYWSGIAADTNTHQFGVLYDGSTVQFLMDTSVLNSQSASFVGSSSLPFTWGKANRSTSVYHYGEIYVGILSSQMFSLAQIAQLHETPYALLQPVPQTCYFDMGAVSTGPTLTAPADTTTQTQPITFSWEAEAGAVAYQLQIATDSAFTTIVHDDATLTTTSKEVPGLAADTLHYWRVRADI